MITIRNLTSFSTKQIKDLFKIARARVKTSFVDIRSAPSEQTEGKILIVIPRKVGNAVQRNKLRRRIKELFYLEKGYAQGVDYIFLAKSPEINTLSFDQLKQLMQQAFGA
jgi:ribonuclease P protein component